MSNKLTLTYDEFKSLGTRVEVTGVNEDEVIYSLGAQNLLHEIGFNEIAIFITNLNKDERELLNKYISDNENLDEDEAKEAVVEIWQDMTDSTSEPDRLDELSLPMSMAKKLFDLGYRK